MWVFGYGSLMWKVDFPFETSEVGYITGYLRRFAQYSIDHRGVPDKPGRVATLIPTPTQPENTVWGVAYKIKDSDIEQVTRHLDYREKNGYSKTTVTFHPQNSEVPSFPLTVYVAMEDNESFAGITSVEDIAKEVVSRVGPSGTNKQYVYSLAKAMRSIAPDVNDEHLFSLEAALRKIDPEIVKLQREEQIMQQL